jgi:hypothetical protein
MKRARFMLASVRTLAAISGRFRWLFRARLRGLRELYRQKRLSMSSASLKRARMLRISFKKRGLA